MYKTHDDKISSNRCRCLLNVCEFIAKHTNWIFSVSSRRNVDRMLCKQTATQSHIKYAHYPPGVDWLVSNYTTHILLLWFIRKKSLSHLEFLFVPVPFIAKRFIQLLFKFTSKEFIRNECEDGILKESKSRIVRVKRSFLCRCCNLTLLVTPIYGT